MVYTSAADHALMSSGGDEVERGLVVGTRDELFRGVVGTIHEDSITHERYALDLTSITGSGTPTDAFPGMTLDIGTTAGAHDVGQVRIRFYGSDSDTVTIAGTSFAECPIEVGHYVTAIFEYLPWKVPKRFVETLNMDGTIASVDVFLDYDLTFSGGSNPLPPKGNITAGHNADGTPKNVLPFGWEDTPGCGYRTVHLSALDSAIQNPGATLGTILWYLGDCSILGGGAITDYEIDVQVPIGFRYIHLFAADSAGRQDLFFRHMPLWCDSKADPQFVFRNFNVTSDETESGREFQFEFFGQRNEADVEFIPSRSLVCYFEEVSWTDGDTPPESYRQQSMGWVTNDVPELKAEGSTYSIQVGSTEHFKRAFRAFSVTLLDTGSAGTNWTEIEHITIDRAAAWSCYANDTLWSLCNIYFSGYRAEVATVTLTEGDCWSQLVDVVSHAALGVVGCDSLGNIFIRRPYWGLSDPQRAIVPEAMRVTNADWGDNDPPSLPTLYLKPTGSVRGNGEVWVSGGRAVFASQAPGLRESYGVGQGEINSWLQEPVPQGDLNRWTGLSFWHENLERATINLILLGNFDVIEPCWQQPVLITYLDDTLRGETFTNAPFLVKHVSIQHSNAPDETTPPKRITWTLEQVSSGDDGETAPVDVQMSGVVPPSDGTCDLTAGFTSSGSICSVEFTDTSTGDLVFAWLWDFGDGEISIEQNPTHVYAEAGTYSVTLYVASDCGEVDSFTDDVTVDAEAIAASASTSIDGDTVTFTDTSTADSAIVSWLWDFGDGETSTEQNPVHTYAVIDSYDWTLTVTSECGSTDSTGGTVDLSALVADFIFTVGDSLDVRFYDRSNTPGTTITSWDWDFDDGSSIDHSQNPTHTYGAGGSYDVQLTIHTADSRSASVTKTVDADTETDWVHASDFTNLDTLDDGWEVMDSQGAFSSGVGFVPSGSNEPRIFRNFDFSTVIYRFDTFYSHNHVGGSATQTTSNTVQTAVGAIVDGVYDWTDSGDYHEAFTSSKNWTHSAVDSFTAVGWATDLIDAVVCYCRTSGIGLNTITGITLYGHGHNPFLT